MSTPRPCARGAFGALATFAAFAAFSAFFAFVAFEREASADVAGGAHWFVETVGASCGDQRAALEREIRLACDAIGGSCSVAASPKDAELRAVLDCSGSSAATEGEGALGAGAGSERAWTLVTRTVDGTVLSSMELSGPRSDRLREAAVEVARDAAPERSLAIETLRFSLPHDAPAAPLDKSAEKLAFALGGTAATSSDDAIPSMFGIRILAGLELASSIRATAALQGEAGGAGADSARAFRTGLGVAFGAPFDPRSPMGIAIEGGLSGTSLYGTTLDGYSHPNLTTNTRLGAYGQGSFVLQWPRAGVRPFAALTAAVFTDRIHIGGGAEAGLAFAVF